MYRKKLESIAILFLLIIGGVNVSAQNKYEYLYKDLPFQMPVLQQPVFPDNHISLKDCGGIPDGITLNTDAFERAMNELSGRGGGVLVVPAGLWFTGPIVFKSNINLHLEKGAVILFSPDFELYPLVKTIFEGKETRRCQSPVSGNGLENIAITGEGVINGSGEPWRPLKKGKVTEGHWKKVVGSGGVLKDSKTWYPNEKEYHRPVMISFVKCKNILLEGVLFENSPAWNIHPLMCENLIIDDIKVRNPFYAQNGDGLDIESCKNVIVVNSSFDVGDDAICIKSGKDEEGRRRARPTENVIVDNCRVFKGHGGFVVGSEMSGGVKNISVSNCQFLGTNIGLRFKSARGRGGIVEDIYIRNINMFDIQDEPLSFNLYYFTQKTDIVPPVDETTPQFRNIYISNVTARDSKKAMLFNGLPEEKISGIYIENTVIKSRLGAELSEAKNVHLKNVRIYPEEGPALILNNVEDISGHTELLECSSFK